MIGISALFGGAILNYYQQTNKISMNNSIGHYKETVKIEQELTNLIVGAVLSGQKGVLVRGIEVSWKPLKEQLTSNQREQEAKRIAKLNLAVIL